MRERSDALPLPLNHGMGENWTKKFEARDERRCRFPRNAFNSKDLGRAERGRVVPLKIAGEGSAKPQAICSGFADKYLGIEVLLCGVLRIRVGDLCLLLIAPVEKRAEAERECVALFNSCGTLLTIRLRKTLFGERVGSE